MALVPLRIYYKTLHYMAYKTALLWTAHATGKHVKNLVSGEKSLKQFYSERDKECLSQRDVAAEGLKTWSPKEAEGPTPTTGSGSRLGRRRAVRTWCSWEGLPRRGDPASTLRTSGNILGGLNLSRGKQGPRGPTGPSVRCCHLLKIKQAVHELPPRTVTTGKAERSPLRAVVCVSSL